jgi:hypothetical protein
MLTDRPECRDCDRMLVSYIWNKESGAGSVEDFLIELVQGKLTHFESIRRMRQKLQEKHEGLRGLKYESRHGMEAVVCEQLSFFDRW